MQKSVSSSIGMHATSDAAPMSTAGSALQNEGNYLMQAGKPQLAMAAYTKAILSAEAIGESQTDQALLYYCRSTAKAKLGQNFEAMLDAKKAIDMNGKLVKAHHALACAHLSLRRFKAAVMSARAGERLLNLKADRTTDFTLLLDQVAAAGAQQGDYAAFDGRILEVRSAGKDAWLGKPAPEDPTLDGPQPMRPPLQLDYNKNIINVDDQNTQNTEQQCMQVARIGGQRMSFRSVKEAVEAAKDGDQVILLPGIHNGMGETINIAKRILIRGSGSLGESKIDQRANCPTFRISRSAVLMNIEVDMTGFREAVLITGSERVRPLLQSCCISCSGDDAINVQGEACPTLQKCNITAKKCGLLVSGHSKSKLDDCTMSGCGGQACRAMEHANVQMIRCIMEQNEEECIVGMGASEIELDDCCLNSSQGPAIDLSQTAKLNMSQGSVLDCVGGVWMWDSSRCNLMKVQLQGGTSYAIVTDRTATIQIKECQVTGSLYMCSKQNQEMVQTAKMPSGSSSVFVAPSTPFDWPLEDGPFAQTPNCLAAH